LKVIFAGTPPFSAKALIAIEAAGFDIPLVLTQPDRPAGRGKALQQSAVKVQAMLMGLPVEQPQNLKDPLSHAALIAANADVMVVAAYGLILPKQVLDIPRFGCLNIHASLLPRWRGAAPIQRAIAAGDTETGITIMQMDVGLDTGPMLTLTKVAIERDDTGASLHDKLAVIGAQAIVGVLERMKNGSISGAGPCSLTALAQPTNGMTYAAKLEKSESLIDWRHEASVIERRIRAFDPVPGNATRLQSISDSPSLFDSSPDKNIKIWKARVMNSNDLSLPALLPPGSLHVLGQRKVLVACKDAWLELLELQKPGGRRMTAAVWLASQTSLQGGSERFLSE
jgi:methionyl-tRNA formyltransferase